MRIPRVLSLYLATAGAVAMDDGPIALARFARRPAIPGTRPERLPAHVAERPCGMRSCIRGLKSYARSRYL